MHIGKYTIVSFLFNKAKSHKKKSLLGAVYYYIHYPLLPAVFTGMFLSGMCCISCFFIPVVWLSGGIWLTGDMPVWSVILSSVIGIWGVYFCLKWARYLVNYLKQKIIVVELVLYNTGAFLILIFWGLVGLFSVLH